MSIQALRERQAALNKKMNALLADKGAQTWSKEDQAVFDADSDEAERLQSQITATQRQLDADAENNFRDATRRDAAAGGEDKRTPSQKAMDIFLRKHARDYSAEEVTLVRNTMSTTTGTEGGYTVQPRVAKDLIDLIKSYAFMRKAAGQITTDNGVDLSYPTSDGTSEIGELVPQNTQASAADVSFGTRPLNVYKFGSRVITIPIELLQDSQLDIQAIVYRRMTDRIGRAENAFFTTGTGTAQPTGLVTAASVGKTGATGQTLTIGYDDVVDIVDSLDVGYLAPSGEGDGNTPTMNGAAPGWMFSQTLRRVLRKIKDTTGRPIWTPGYESGITASTPDLLLGYPTYINNDMPVPAANAKSLAFGNLGRYLIRDAMQISMFRFDDSVFMTKGQVGFLAWARAGGNLMDVNSVKLYQHSAT